MAERFGIGADALIAGDDHDELRRFVEPFRARKMDRVQSPHGFNREGTADPTQDGGINLDDEAPAPQAAERSHCSPLLIRGHSVANARPDQGTSRFGEGQRRCDEPGRRSQGSPNAEIPVH